MRLQALIDYLEKIFPLTLAEDWDNVGLLLGDRGQNVERVATCLTIDEAVADEAVADKIDCIVSHHPFPFHASKKWTTDTTDSTRTKKSWSNRSLSRAARVARRRQRRSEPVESVNSRSR